VQTTTRRSAPHSHKREPHNPQGASLRVPLCAGEPHDPEGASLER